MRINLQELIDKQILDNATADSIEAYYDQKYKGKPNTLLLIFAIVGALLIGIGVILIIAHNWDQLPKSIKTVFAFLPLIISQGLVFFTLFKKSDNVIWRETTATALFFSIGTCIALVSQIYHILGDLDTFLLTWMLLAIPIIYLLRSRAVLLFCIIGIFNYGQQVGFLFPREIPIYYWVLMASLVPALWHVYNDEDDHNIFTFLLWGFLLSISIMLATIALEDESPAVVLCYISYFGNLYLLGLHFRVKESSLIKNPFICIGFIGVIIFYIFSSFKPFWEDMLNDSIFDTGLTHGMYLWIALTILFVLTFLYTWKKGLIQPMNIIAYSPVLFLLIFAIHFSSSGLSVIATNLLVLSIAIYLLNQGIENEDLRILNIGMLVLSVLIIARFFDISIPFIIRGLIFIGLGIAFFVANYVIIKKRSNEIN